MNSRYFPQLGMVIIGCNTVVALIEDKCNWKVGEQKLIYFDHNTKG